MTYSDQADLSRDTDFRDRIAAVVATQDWRYRGTPLEWAEAEQWHVAAAPGFAAAYSYGVATGVDRPGRDVAVIPDADLLAAVQARWQASPAPAAPTHDHPDLPARLAALEPQPPTDPLEGAA